MKSKTTQALVPNTLGPFVRLGRGLEYDLIIQRSKGRNAEFIAGVHFADKPTPRKLRQWRAAIQRGIEPNSLLAKPATKSCTWTEDADGNWHTGCQEIHVFISGTPQENGYVYCPYCGVQISMSPAAPCRKEDEQ